MTAEGQLIRLRLPSAFEWLDLVQLLSDRLSVLGGLDEDGVHWVGVAVRESVINAIKHGNRENPAKFVTVDFTLESGERLVIHVLDEGEGFDSQAVADPLAAENLLKASGRGIFFMRNFMDDVSIERAPQGGTLVRMSKSLKAS